MCSSFDLLSEDGDFWFFIYGLMCLVLFGIKEWLRLCFVWYDFVVCNVFLVIVYRLCRKGW